MAIKKTRTIKHDPITGYNWPTGMHKGKGEPAKKGPISGDPINNDKWPTDMGRKNA